MVPVIDLFAGPGGLGEGFSSFKVKNGAKQIQTPFHISLSIEKDPIAHQTLLLRAFYRNMAKSSIAMQYYYNLVKNGRPDRLEEYVLKINNPDLIKIYESSFKEAICAELGAGNEQLWQLIGARIESIRNESLDWVLIGGPPCQAYSLAGRSRNSGIPDYRMEDDSRSTLYRSFLHVISMGLPSIFVMENVKGMLSAKLNGKRVFQMILEDLRWPGRALGSKNREVLETEYMIVPITAPDEKTGQATLFGDEIDEKRFIVRSELYGIPQHRHRVILIGIRYDVAKKIDPKDTELQLQEDPNAKTSLQEVISDLPRLACFLSSRKTKGGKTRAEGTWKELLNFLKLTTKAQWLKEYGNKNEKSLKVASEIHSTIQYITSNFHGIEGGQFITFDSYRRIDKRHLAGWFFDRRLKGILNHETRPHMDTDLERYLFAACFAKVHGKSPHLDDFPEELKPDHKSAGTGNFSDRFRVQVAGEPATTITSHISKDGHYFIHYDGSQCRSLSVREAARIQTFPDNYFFCGSRTSQFHQVGNAVPPFLANQIAGCVWAMLRHRNLPLREKF